MTRFTVRVELFGDPDEQDYDLLHERMQIKKYHRVNKSGDGDWQHLPSATYDHQSHSTASSICDEVWEIASSVLKKPGVLITQSESRS